MSQKHPDFLLNPSDETIQRLYHGKMIKLLQGHVRLSDVRGWADNPRLELEMRKWKSEFAGADMKQESLYDMMKKTKHVKLKELADSIRVDGVREPIVLTFGGKLIDGNRRFFASKFAYESESDAAQKERLEKIPAFVMLADASTEDEQQILVEENFSPSLKKDWPDYVKAGKIYEEFEKGMSKQAIALKFGWNPTQVGGTLRTWEVINSFLSYAVEAADMESGRGGLGLDHLEAVQIASDNYQFFNEAQKSLYAPLIKDYDSDFAEMFFRLIAQGNFFTSFHDVRCAYDGYKDEVGRDIMERGDANGGKDIRALIQMQKSRVKKAKSVQEDIAEFVQFLNNLSTKDLRDISDDSLEDLRKSLVLVQNLAQTAKKGEQ